MLRDVGVAEETAASGFQLPAHLVAEGLRPRSLSRGACSAHARRSLGLRKPPVPASGAWVLAGPDRVEPLALRRVAEQGVDVDFDDGSLTRSHEAEARLESRLSSSVPRALIGRTGRRSCGFPEMGEGARIGATAGFWSTPWTEGPRYGRASPLANGSTAAPAHGPLPAARRRQPAGRAGPTHVAPRAGNRFGCFLKEQLGDDRAHHVGPLLPDRDAPLVSPSASSRRRSARAARRPGRRRPRSGPRQMRGRDVGVPGGPERHA